MHSLLAYDPPHLSVVIHRNVRPLIPHVLSRGVSITVHNGRKICSQLCVGYKCTFFEIFLPFVANFLECGGYSSECVKLFGILSPHLLHHRIGI